MVMEVATGKIKAIANLGLQNDGSYWEDLNYAIRVTEPGSTFKLATLLSLLEDHKVSLNDKITLDGGSWKVAGHTVFDSEPHDFRDFTVKEAFEISSNVGMAKLAVSHYGSNPSGFVAQLKKLRLDQPTGIDLLGEGTPVVKHPGSRTWSATTLPWMAFGYEVLVSPLQTLTLYNAVANNGRMMKPYLVSAVQESGVTIKENQPTALMDNICSETTLRELQDCLKGVCKDPEGTAHSLFQHSFFPVAGKTGTALVANGTRGYADHVYQASFVGYFPADHPRYSCIVVIKNHPFAKTYLGAKVAGPVFKELADKLMSLDPDIAAPIPADSAGQQNITVASPLAAPMRGVPNVKGMGLKDALYLLESENLRVAVRGRGKVMAQSLEPGSEIRKNETITIQLD
jgi:cell division protein FtsI (penicillin-binding protein 3)